MVKQSERIHRDVHFPCPKPYPPDLTDVQWEILALFIPEPSLDATRPTISRREMVNGILYLLRMG